MGWKRLENFRRGDPLPSAAGFNLMMESARGADHMDFFRAGSIPFQPFLAETVLVGPNGERDFCPGDPRYWFKQVRIVTTPVSPPRCEGEFSGTPEPPDDTPTPAAAGVFGSGTGTTRNRRPNAQGPANALGPPTDFDLNTDWQQINRTTTVAIWHYGIHLGEVGTNDSAEERLLGSGTIIKVFPLWDQNFQQYYAFETGSGTAGGSAAFEIRIELAVDNPLDIPPGHINLTELIDYFGANGPFIMVRKLGNEMGDCNVNLDQWFPAQLTCPHEPADLIAGDGNQIYGPFSPGWGGWSSDPSFLAQTIGGRSELLLAFGEGEKWVDEPAPQDLCE